MQPLLRGLHARMLARCQAVETGPLGAAAAAYTEAAQLLEAEGMLGGWRELGGLLQIGGASEAAVSPHTPYPIAVRQLGSQPALQAEVR